MDTIQFTGTLVEVGGGRVNFARVDEIKVYGARVGLKYKVTAVPIEPELKGCPYCGGTTRVIKSLLGKLFGFRAWCENCGSLGQWKEGRLDAIVVSNKRENIE